MRIVNFAQGKLLILGMFASFYLVGEGRILSFLGPVLEGHSSVRCARRR
jgi:branched-subunit amino acid ABC-type transport system permease component